MKKNLVRGERDVQKLQGRVIKLEQQLAEARAALLALTSPNEDRDTAKGAQKYHQQLQAADPAHPNGS